MSRSLWPDNNPDSLFDICIDYCVEALSRFVSGPLHHNQLFQGLNLSHVVNQQLFLACVKAGVLCSTRALSLFRGQQQMKLKRLNLVSVTDLTDEDLEDVLAANSPTELQVGSDFLSPKSLAAINGISNGLVSLRLANAERILVGCRDSDAGVSHPRLNCPNLRFLTLNKLMPESANLLDISLSSMTYLTLLDISNSDVDIAGMENLKYLLNLQILNLHNVTIEDLESVFKVIAEIKSLRVLDLGQSSQYDPVIYPGDVHSSMRGLIGSLPLLTRLELAGTNLAGQLEEEAPMSCRPGKCQNSAEEEKRSRKQFAIPGLEGRYLEYLGLLNCAHNACDRENIPANQVAGDANEGQILLAVSSYVERQELLLISLNNLFHLFKHQTCSNHKQALEGILSAMKAYKEEKTIQISGSATLFYIVKGECKHFFNAKIRKRLVNVLLDAMETHCNEAAMLRNGCLTLCHFKIPQDVMRCYERLVSLLLRIMMLPVQNQENFVQRICIYLLNSLACQVDRAEKELVGKLGAFNTMLSLIKEKLDRNICDEVMEVAWSMMWNVTDETAVNCERYIEDGGMDVFIQCLNKFPNEEELLRNMMGLIGNVAEVDYLRSQLLTSSYITIFSDLLDSSSDGIEVSYNACGVLAHLMSDGPEVWRIGTPSRDLVLRKMDEAISRWKLNTKRNINYRSFQPILRLLPNYVTPEVQLWAVWALCNLTKVYKSKYCPLLESEGGLVLLESLCKDTRPCPKIKCLADQVIRRCHLFHKQPDSTTDDEEDPSAPGPMLIDD